MEIVFLHHCYRHDLKENDEGGRPFGRFLRVSSVEKKETAADIPAIRPNLVIFQSGGCAVFPSAVYTLPIRKSPEPEKYDRISPVFLF